MHYLITGHTGFKGTWMSLFLKQLGHQVSGISLPPENNSLFSSANISDIFEFSEYIDIRDFKELQIFFQDKDFDFVIHLAAQPLVLESYRVPFETFETNIQGTLNLLQVILEKVSIKGTLVITTDKVYTNSSNGKTFKEQDPLGGDDPYSASKAAIDLVVQSWAKYVSNHPVAIARAGNVIGGGDWAENRLLPDLIKAYFEDKKPVIRNPGFVRPWQHVLDCINGYYELSQKMTFEGIGGAWNFGPPKESVKTVSEVNEQVAKAFGKNSDFTPTSHQNNLHESSHLMLDSEKAFIQLNWTNLMNFERAVRSTVDFYKSTLNGEPSKQCMVRDISTFLEERNDENRTQV